MTQLAPMVLALVCAIFGTASELADRNFTTELYEKIIVPHPRHTYLHKTYSMRYFDTRQKRDSPDLCEPFQYRPGKKILTHPKRNASDKTYSSQTTCFTIIESEDGNVIELTFVDMFELEESMPKCEHDYLEIRDGKYGYGTPMYKFCGKSFPPTVTSLSPYLWLKFHSDDTVEYTGFKIEIGFPSNKGRTIHESCYITAPETFQNGIIGSKTDDVRKCREASTGSLDIQWKIVTRPNTRIYLNITEFKLASPNECLQNIVQVFGSEPNFDHLLDSFCGSVATSLTTLTEAKEKGPTNIMFVRMFTKDMRSNFTAEFTGYRTLGTDETCDKIKEVDCLDSTCIDIGLKCNKRANCRLKADEDPELCKTHTDSLMKEPETRNILIILCLILTGICSVLVYKCVRKLYLDQKQINENLAKSCEDRLDKLSNAAFMLDPGILTREPEPRASLERENHDNEMVKQQRSRRKSTSSIESDFPDINDWSENRLLPTDEIRVERKDSPKIQVKPKRDFSKKEELLRSMKSSKDEEERNIRDVAIEVPDALEAACQTRESLFETVPLSSSERNSSSNGHRHSGATVTRPSPTPKTSEITIELIRQLPETSLSQDRRPMSSETTRSAPDVIIVSKPLC